MNAHRLACFLDYVCSYPRFRENKLKKTTNWAFPVVGEKATETAISNLSTVFPKLYHTSLKEICFILIPCCKMDGQLFHWVLCMLLSSTVHVGDRHKTYHLYSNFNNNRSTSHTIITRIIKSISMESILF